MHRITAFFTLLLTCLSLHAERPNVLVTGGAGYIGSHISLVLHESGYQPVVVDNLYNGHEGFVQWGPCYVGDICDSLFLEQVFNETNPIAVIHCAGLIEVGESVRDPALYYENNVGGSLTLLQAMRKQGVPTIIFSSTCATYGEVQEVPIPEDHPQNPINPYGHSKLMVEQIVQDYAKAYGLHYAFLRYFNAAGADFEARIGEDRTHETHLIPLVMDAITGHRESLQIFGDDYNTPDGTAVRDYIHVLDLAKAHVLALEWIEGNGQDLALNLGTGTGYSVREVIDRAAEVSGLPVPHTLGERRPGDAAKLIANSELAKKTLEWEPAHSDLETILSTAWQWQKKKRGLK